MNHNLVQRGLAEYKAGPLSLLGIIMVRGTGYTSRGVSTVTTTITFIPGGAIGILLKSNSPSIYVCADIFGFCRQGISIFKVIMACGISRHHI